MKTKTLMKLTGGVTVMTSVFLLLIIVEQLKSVNSLSTTIFNPTSNPVAPLANNLSAVDSKKIISQNNQETFDTTTNGDVLYYDKENSEKAFHYKAIKSEKIQDPNAKAKLQLEINSQTGTRWQETNISWVDNAEGILYFFYLKEENGKKIPAENYTGNYKLTFE